MTTTTAPSSIPAEWDRNLTTRAERYAAGKALRSKVPRSSHAEWAPDLQALRVVVLTTSRRMEDVAATYAAGANTYIEKPEDFQRFVHVLQTIHRYWLDMALLPPLPE